MTSGGYRRPANPATVSGPGAHSRRTDTQPKMQLPNAEYGEQAAFQQAQSAAPMASAAASAPGAQPPPSDPLAGVMGMLAPTQAADQPVTNGAALGAGAGVEALGYPQDPQDRIRADAQALAPKLNALIYASQMSDATPEFRRFVRELVANQ